MKKTIAENMFEIMVEKDIDIVWYGDLTTIEECAFKSKIKSKHPKITINKILNGLEKSVLFEKGYIKADFNGTNRQYRSFKIKKEPTK